MIHPFYWRLYVIAALIAAGLFAPLVFAPIPWLMLAVYLYVTFHPRTEQRYGIPFHMILALSLPLFFEPIGRTWLSPLFALPVLPLLDNSLRQFASIQECKPNSPRNRSVPIDGRGTRPTPLARTMVTALITISLIALALSGWTLLLSACLVALYLAASMAAALPGNKFEVSVETGLTGHRVVAGHTGKAQIKLSTKGRKKSLGGYLSFDSPLPWLSIKPIPASSTSVYKRGSRGQALSETNGEDGGLACVFCGKQAIELEASFTPPLAGPAAVALDAAYIDPRGLLRFDFTLDSGKLLVIPRARHAEWMARKYLDISRGGSLQIAGSASSSLRASRQGIEFYGLRPYQPGDSARAIDWKHTSKLRQVIVKEFMDKKTDSAVIAVNLSVGGDEERDKMSYDLITTALTLARENIPSALAAYDNQKVIKTTTLLNPRQALVQALDLTHDITITPDLRRFLAVPDAGRLMGNLRRLKTVGTGPANRLAALLQLEYASLEEQAKRSPAVMALTNTLAFMKTKPNIIVVSARNHDAAVLAFHRQSLESKGYRFIE